ncbi:hypothetical protein [Neisseria meningitidis]|uniref:hypothetical protein n=1 Tax=Neisseria meningitidis TaxID=487 RepID=UPI001296A72C|nr:hypothetical protein [Neisseria meningitidis]
MEVTRNLKQAKPNEPDSRLRGNDEFQVAVLVFYFCENNGISACGYLPEKTETAPPSFPRRRESRHSMLRQFIGND